MLDILKQRLAARHIDIRARGNRRSGNQSRQREAESHAEAGHRSAAGEGHHQAHQGRQAQGRSADPGRQAAHHRQEEGRSADRHRAAARGRSEDAAAVREFPGLIVLEISANVKIPDGELSESFVRASGPGGQNVNKVASAVELRFDVANSPSLPDALRARAAGAQGSASDRRRRARHPGQSFPRSGAQPRRRARTPRRHHPRRDARAEKTHRDEADARVEGTPHRSRRRNVRSTNRRVRRAGVSIEPPRDFRPFRRKCRA